MSKLKDIRNLSINPQKKSTNSCLKSHQKDLIDRRLDIRKKQKKKWSMLKFSILFTF